VGLAFWALFNPQDRYLQALLPWMIAVTVAVLALAVREGVAARVAVGLLVGLQLVWGGDACFLPSHGYRAPLAEAIERLGGSYTPGAPERSEPFAPWPQIGRALPRGARVLIHEGDEHLGLGTPVVVDWLPFAYGIDYGACRSMREVYDLVRSMGITHVVWELRSRGADSLAGDLLFYAYAQRHVTGRAAIGQHALGSVPETAPPATPLGKVVVLSCTGPYASGLYEVADVGIAPRPADDASRYPPPRVAWSTLGEEERVRALASAEFLVTDPGCTEVPAQGAAAFERLASRGPHTLYARR
jgi:hypothetical protein